MDSKKFIGQILDDGDELSQDLVDLLEEGYALRCSSQITGHDFWIVQTHFNLDKTDFDPGGLPVWSLPEIRRAISDELPKKALIHAMELKGVLGAKYYHSGKIEPDDQKT